jgi:hypothetical protein
MTRYVALQGRARQAKGPERLAQGRPAPHRRGPYDPTESLLDLVWHVLGESPWVLGVTIVGLVGTVAGPWAIIKAVSRPTKADPQE